MATSDDSNRSQLAKPDKAGNPSFDWKLTSPAMSDLVKFVAGPFAVLPVVFVPGIMGSNLMSNTKPNDPVWRLDVSVGLPWSLLGYAFKTPGDRQKALHPARCKVDPRGAVPSKPHGSVHGRKTYVERGWGTVAESSYQEFLIWLEEQLNPVDCEPANWHEYKQMDPTISAMPKPGEKRKLFTGLRMGLGGEPFGGEKKPFEWIRTDDLIQRGRLHFPVYAVGYNWLDDNAEAAQSLSERITAIIAENNRGFYRCRQVILVTHSMGGLVARACADLKQVKEAQQIAGIVHGVMPTVGAAVAYRRCKLGMHDEDPKAGLVIGSNGQDVTAVFAQAPGALELLPSKGYRPHWLSIKNPNGSVAGSLPTKDGADADPYECIYLRRDRWWGLVNEAWLSPLNGAPIRWQDFRLNIVAARSFHSSIEQAYHPRTFVLYGADPKMKSFGGISWRVTQGTLKTGPRPDIDAVVHMRPTDVRSDGTNPEYVGGKSERIYMSGTMNGPGSEYINQTSFWELYSEHQDSAGDGTVPVSSGAAPILVAGSSVHQQFKLMEIDHEGAFKNPTAQFATLYAITKIAGAAVLPK